MSLEQIELFIDESITQKRNWETVVLEGGEPTIHPQIKDIISLLVEYKREYAPSMTLILATNGYAKGADKVIAGLPPEVTVNNSSKETEFQEHHMNFNAAPVDIVSNTAEVFHNGCLLPGIYGLGLNRYGYYPHPVCGGIDRIFGKDVGRKHLPHTRDTMTDMFEPLCKYCGHFFDSNELPAGAAEVDKFRCPTSGVSKSWEKAYGDYKSEKPSMSLYGG